MFSFSLQNRNYAIDDTIREGFFIQTIFKASSLLEWQRSFCHKGIIFFFYLLSTVTKRLCLVIF